MFARHSLWAAIRFIEPTTRSRSQTARTCGINMIVGMDILGELGFLVDPSNGNGPKMERALHTPDNL